MRLTRAMINGLMAKSKSKWASVPHRTQVALRNRGLLSDAWTAELTSSGWTWLDAYRQGLADGKRGDHG